MKNAIEFKLKITEIAEKLESGYSVAQVLKEFMPKWGLTRRSVERYIALATDIVARRMKKREAVVESVRADIIAREAETWLKSNLELEARLCAIVSGKVEFDRTMKKGQDTQHVTCYPTCTEVINAIDLLLRLRGVYKAADGKPELERPVIKIIVDNEKERAIVEKIMAQGKK